MRARRARPGPMSQGESGATSARRQRPFVLTGQRQVSRETTSPTISAVPVQARPAVPAMRRGQPAKPPAATAVVAMDHRVVIDRRLAQAKLCAIRRQRPGQRLVAMGLAPAGHVRPVLAVRPRQRLRVLRLPVQRVKPRAPAASTSIVVPMRRTITAAVVAMPQARPFRGQGESRSAVKAA